MQKMGYVGCRTINELRHNAKFIKISAAGLRESHVHDVINYKGSAELYAIIGVNTI